MSIETLFLDLSEPAMSLDVEADGNGSCWVAFAARLSFPTDSEQSQQLGLARCRWRVAIHDAASSVRIQTSSQTVGTLNYKAKSLSGVPTCLVQVEMKASHFSRMLSLLQSGKGLSSAEVTVELPGAEWGLPECSVPVFAANFNSNFEAIVLSPAVA